MDGARMVQALSHAYEEVLHSMVYACANSREYLACDDVLRCKWILMYLPLSRAVQCPNLPVYAENLKHR
jgi:hypothetical protein